MGKRRSNPAAARMLLSSDGSTTALLESMLNEELRLIVDRQRTVPVRFVAPEIVRHLRAAGDSFLLERHSALATAAGRVVSRNYVVCRLRLPPPLWQQLRSGDTAIGKLWSQLRMGGSRELLEAGAKTSGAFADERGGHARVCYKHYVLRNGEEPLMYIEEQFNPAFVVPPARLARSR